MTTEEKFEKTNGNTTVIYLAYTLANTLFLIRRNDVQVKIEFQGARIVKSSHELSLFEERQVKKQLRKSINNKQAA